MRIPIFALLAGLSLQLRAAEAHVQSRAERLLSLSEAEFPQEIYAALTGEGLVKDNYLALEKELVAHLREVLNAEFEGYDPTISDELSLQQRTARILSLYMNLLTHKSRISPVGCAARQVVVGSPEAFTAVSTCENGGTHAQAWKQLLTETLVTDPRSPLHAVITSGHTHEARQPSDTAKTFWKSQGAFLGSVAWRTAEQAGAVNVSGAELGSLCYYATDLASLWYLASPDAIALRAYAYAEAKQTPPSNEAMSSTMWRMASKLNLGRAVNPYLQMTKNLLDLE